MKKLPILLTLALALGASCSSASSGGSSQSPGYNETNCGPEPCVGFNAKDQQFRDRGIHKFKAPGPKDTRGPCPGLNAAANHGYLPHNGIATISETTTGLSDMYGMGEDLAGLLAAYAVAMDGDVATESYSIGKPAGGLGLSKSHNNFEGDSSTARSDAYMNNGDATSLNMTRFAHLYSLGTKVDFANIPQINYYIEDVRTQFSWNQQTSIANNPYYFNAPFSGVIVVPAAHNLLITLFSNHTPKRTFGYLDTETLRNFFSILGNTRPLRGEKYEPLEWNPGHEHIPNEEWARRPVDAPYGVAQLLADLVIGYEADPSTLRIGGNTGTPNSYVGVSVSDLTNGTYSDETLLQGNNLGCFMLQAMQAEVPSSALQLLEKYVSPLVSQFNCAPLEAYNTELFEQFPGYTMSQNARREGLLNRVLGLLPPEIA